jgi:hypothetical protein
MGRLSPLELAELPELLRTRGGQAQALFLTASHCASTLAEAIVEHFWDDVSAAEQADLVSCVESLRRASACADRLLASLHASETPPPPRGDPTS